MGSARQGTRLVARGRSGGAHRAAGVGAGLALGLATAAAARGWLPGAWRGQGEKEQRDEGDERRERE
jgi:hypothetical protein